MDLSTLSPALFILMYVVFPLWVLAGFADWACHRATDIAHTSGLKENLVHVLMCAEIGLGMLAVALYEVNAAILVIVLIIFVVHEATVYWDLDYSTLLRDVGPFEQMVHSFLEMLPLVSLALLVTLGWPQALAIVGIGDDLADWTLRPRAEPWPRTYLMGALIAVGLFNALPLLQETISCAIASGQKQRRRRDPDQGKVEPAFEPEITARTLRNPGPK